MDLLRAVQRLRQKVLLPQIQPAYHSGRPAPAVENAEGQHSRCFGLHGIWASFVEHLGFSCGVVLSGLYGVANVRLCAHLICQRFRFLSDFGELSIQKVQGHYLVHKEGKTNRAQVKGRQKQCITDWLQCASRTVKLYVHATCKQRQL
jgi:hypothetical protein